MEEEEDKELLKIRIDTLKTMIGKLKDKNNSPQKKSDSNRVHANHKIETVAGHSERSMSWTKLKTLHVNKYKYEKPSNNVAKSEPAKLRKVANHFPVQSMFLTSNAINRYKWDKADVENKIIPTVNVKKKVNYYNVETNKNKKIFSQFKVVNSESSHRKVPVRTSSWKYVKSQSSHEHSNIKQNKCTKTEILSKYKVVHKHENKKLPNQRTCYVWKKGDSPNVSTEIPQMQLFSHQKSNDSFVRRRYNVTRRTNLMQSRYKLVAFPHNVKYHSRESFTTRRMKYVLLSHSSSNSKIVTQRPTSKVNLNSPNSDLILSRHGTHFKIAGNLRSLRRLSTSMENKPPKRVTKYKPIVKRTKYKLQRMNSATMYNVTSTKRKIASQVLKKSLSQAQRKKVNKNKYCLFYNRFGKCKRGKECRYIHDPDKVAVCTRFLRGTCKDENCVFSHKIDPKKMPVCSYFLQGKCTKDNCPYRHVNVSESAAVCEDFLNGYCPKDEQCTKKHVLECIEFTKDGRCSNGKSCKMIHRANIVVSKRRRSSSMSGARKPKGFKQKRRRVQIEEPPLPMATSVELVQSPLKTKGKLHLLPKFISDKIGMSSVTKEIVEPTAIRNLFASSSNTLNDEVYDTETCARKNTEEFISLTSDSEDENEYRGQHLSRTFSFKEEDYIAL